MNILRLTEDVVRGMMNSNGNVSVSENLMKLRNCEDTEQLRSYYKKYHT